MNTRTGNAMLGAVLVILVMVNGGYADLITGLVAYYPFNGNADDESGNLNHGAVHGAILTEDRFGNPYSAYGFDGTDDYVNIGKSIISDDSYTYSVWVKRQETGLTNGTVLCNWSNNEGGPALIDWGVNKADEIRFLAGKWESANPVRHENCGVIYRGALAFQNLLEIAYFRLAPCAPACLNAFHEPEKA